MAARTGAQRIWTPSNIITITRILLVPVFVAALLAPWPDWAGLDERFTDDAKAIAATIVFIIISCTDWLDGYLARRRDEVTDFGKFMDPLADKILVAAALISLVELGSLPTWVVLIILAREFIVSGIRMMAASKGVVIAASMLGKFKTVFQMIAVVMFTIKDTHMVGAFSDAYHDYFWDLSWIVMLVALGLTIASLIDYLSKSRVIFGFANPAAENEEPVQELGEHPQDALLDLAGRVISVGQATGKTVCTAESLTGGMIGEVLTRVSGASDVYRGGIISYTNQVKHKLLDVSQDVLDTVGAVSAETACAMASGALQELHASVAVSVTGIAGPGGAEPGKPVGTVFMGVATPDSVECHRYVFEGDRESVRMQTAATALQALLTHL